MDDPQRKPGGGDRDPLVARIRRAADQGRIAAADRDIRLGNVAGAQSMAELDLMGRDLDQLETSLPAGSGSATQPSAPVWSGPVAPDLADEVTGKAVDAAKSTARSLGIVTIAVVVIALVGVAGSAWVASRSGSGHDSTTGELLDPLPIPSGTDTTEPTGDPSLESPGPAGASYALTRPGIRGFLALYRARFGTSEVVDLTMYGDYVVVNVPIAGKARHSGWLYRPGQGFTSFGGVRANFPGAQPVDTDRLAIAALVRNVARARSSLNVEDPTVSYVIVRYYAPADPVPSVDIHVSNTFGESGYLATTLDGSVERAYPFAS